MSRHCSIAEVSIVLPSICVCPFCQHLGGFSRILALTYHSGSSANPPYYTYTYHLSDKLVHAQQTRTLVMTEVLLQLCMSEQLTLKMLLGVGKVWCLLNCFQANILVFTKQLWSGNSKVSVSFFSGISAWTLICATEIPNILSNNNFIFTVVPAAAMIRLQHMLKSSRRIWILSAWHNLLH